MVIEIIMSELISLAEYARLNGREASSVRRKAMRGGFKTARKIGRNWVIDKNEPYTDLREKQENIKIGGI